MLTPILTLHSVGTTSCNIGDMVAEWDNQDNNNYNKHYQHHNNEHNNEHGIWAVGPESIGARALVTAEDAEFELPDLDGNLFRLSSLRGQKVLVYAWAPY